MHKNKQKELSLDTKWYFIEGGVTVVIALIISLLLVLVTSFLIKMLNIDTEYIPVLVAVIKILSILLASLFCMKRPRNGWLRGGLIGITYIMLSFFVFSLLGNGFVFGLGLLNDLAIGMIAGVICGIISVNIHNH